MKRTVTILMLVFTLFVMMGCFNSDTPVEVKPIVQSYWDGFQSIPSLFDDMKAKQFYYSNSWDDISYLSDYPKSLTSYFNDRGGNCLDSTTWTAEFIKYKSTTVYLADSFETELMLSNQFVPAKWHWHCYISIYGNLYEQSNVSFYQINSEQEQKEMWFNKGYRYFEKKGRWVRK